MEEGRKIVRSEDRPPRTRLDRAQFLKLLGAGAVAGSTLPILNACGGATGDASSRQEAEVQPVASRVRTPGEWERHSRCVMAWPYRKDLWGDQLESVQGEYAAVAKAIARSEPVLMVANPGSGAAARRRCGGNNVEVVEFRIDDTWTRDSGPIIVFDGNRRLGLDFEFNAWGRKFKPWENDDQLPVHVCEHLGIERRYVDMVLEGGAVITDGEGTMITTEQCLLNPNRNGKMSKVEQEEVLKKSFGVEKIVWLPYGLYGDTITNGHVDGVCAYLAPGKVMALTAPGSGPDERRLKRNREVLESTRDARGRRFEIVELEEYPIIRVGGEVTTHSYINFYEANGAVIVPTAGLPEDEKALKRIRTAFPHKEVVGVSTPTLSYGGGGVHCITQQIPA